MEKYLKRLQKRKEQLKMFDLYRRVFISSALNQRTRVDHTEIFDVRPDALPLYNGTIVQMEILGRKCCRLLGKCPEFTVVQQGDCTNGDSGQNACGRRNREIERTRFY